MKGWTVRTESTKNRGQGVAGREIYLHNHAHPNHANTERIIDIWGSEQHMQRIAYSGESYAAHQAAKGKGGRPPSSYAIELTLNLPKKYRPTDQQWLEIMKDTVRALAKVCEVDVKQLASVTRAVLHQQNQTPDLDPRTGRERGTGDHLHLCVGKFTPPTPQGQQGRYLRNLQRKTATNAVKQAFNEATLKHCGYDWTEYRNHKLKAQEHANKRTVPTWKVKAARELEAIQRQQQALDEKARQLDELQDLVDEKFTDAMAVKRLLNNFKRQADKWLSALTEQDLKQMNRQQNRMQKSLTELDSFRASPELEQFSQEISQIVEKVNNQANPPLKWATLKKKP